MTEERYFKLPDHWRNVEVQSLYWPGDESYPITKGKHRCIDIIPYVEAGEMAWNIWFEVEYENGEIVRYNGFHIEGVKVKTK